MNDETGANSPSNATAEDSDSKTERPAQRFLIGSQRPGHAAEDIGANRWPRRYLSK